jgi:hypothetical protein
MSLAIKLCYNLFGVKVSRKVPCNVCACCRTTTKAKEKSLDDSTESGEGADK